MIRFMLSPNSLDIQCTMEVLSLAIDGVQGRVQPCVAGFGPDMTESRS